MKRIISKTILRIRFDLPANMIRQVYSVSTIFSISILTLSIYSPIRANYRLERLEKVLLDKSEGFATFAGAAGTADAVNIIGLGGWGIGIADVGDITDR